MSSDGPVFNRYVALGDSNTEGLDDPYPWTVDGAEAYRGWADRLAERLAAINPALTYANLAVRGRKIAEIEETQLAPALAMQPDLASVGGGVNDVLRPKVDLDVIAGHLRRTQSALREQGATVFSMTLPDLSGSMRLAKLVTERMKIYNEIVRRTSNETGSLVVDLEVELAVYDPRGWSADRLHASAAGHEMISLAAANVLGVPGSDRALDEFRASVPPAEQFGRVRSFGVEVHWVWNHLRPWIMRRVRGTSSGDGVDPKRPELAPVSPLA